jgi:hypothetical protein
MQPTHRQSSVLDCFAPGWGDSARQCLRRAALCSRLAKLASGRKRKKLYQLKNANIRAALRLSPELVRIHADHDRYFGLLSVRLNSSEGVRVHTHENWIDAA